MMSPIYIVLSAVMVLTLFSAATAGILLVLGAGRTQAQKSVIDKLIRITLLGAERYAFRGLRHAERIKATLTAMLVTGAAAVALVLISRFRHLQRCGSSASHR